MPLFAMEGAGLWRAPAAAAETTGARRCLGGTAGLGDPTPRRIRLFGGMATDAGGGGLAAAAASQPH